MTGFVKVVTFIWLMNAMETGVMNNEATQDG
jgi:hypothetical protein